MDLRDEEEQERLWAAAEAIMLAEYYTWGEELSKKRKRKRKDQTDIESDATNSKKQVYQVRDADNIVVLVECDKCSLIGESKISKSMPKPSSDDHENTTITTASLKQTVKITHNFYCTKCKTEKTLLEYEEEFEEDEDEEEED